MKAAVANPILLLLDAAAIALSIASAYGLRIFFDEYFTAQRIYGLDVHMSFYLMYAVTLVLFAYEGLYHRRYDFWHESRLVLKTLVVSLVIVFAYLALTKTLKEYSRAVILIAFILMAFFVPLFKNVAKKILYRIGLWQREAKVYGDDAFIRDEIFGNHYLGYVEATQREPRTVFINSKGTDADTLRAIMDDEIGKRHEVVFIPLLDEFDLTQSHIYELSNTQTSLIVIQNRLKSRYRMVLKRLSDWSMFLVALPLLFPVLGTIAWMIRREEPGSSVLFRQKRLGEEGRVFVCLKFRTMYEESDAMLAEYLEAHPEEVAHYEVYHKYLHDPRVTRIGRFLRRTSLDELPQIFNVFSGEMSFVGPRPYMLNEKDKIGDKLETVLSVKPGITGLWQVSGRNDVDFRERVDLDVWYIRNWNLWMDIVILFKTVKAVLFRKGAR